MPSKSYMKTSDSNHIEHFTNYTDVFLLEMCRTVLQFNVTVPYMVNWQCFPVYGKRRKYSRFDRIDWNKLFVPELIHVQDSIRNT